MPTQQEGYTGCVVAEIVAEVLGLIGETGQHGSAAVGIVYRTILHHRDKVSYRFHCRVHLLAFVLVAFACSGFR
ncbi:MAG: hypothetical protein ACK55I_51240, partial [bacterium]